MSVPSLFLVAAAALVGCRLPGDVEGSLLVSNLRFTPAAFDSFRGNTELRYSLSAPAGVSCTIVRRIGTGPDALVNTICSEVRESRGTHAHTWLGDTAEGLFAPAGNYIGIVRVQDHRFEATVRVFHY